MSTISCDDREVTSLCRSGCPQESSNERQNFETLTLLILGDVSRDACYSLLRKYGFIAE